MSYVYFQLGVWTWTWFILGNKKFGPKYAVNSSLLRWAITRYSFSFLVSRCSFSFTLGNNFHGSSCRTSSYLKHSSVDVFPCTPSSLLRSWIALAYKCISLCFPTCGHMLTCSWSHIVSSSWFRSKASMGASLNLVLFVLGIRIQSWHAHAYHSLTSCSSSSSS